jgi:hypothetical protein
VHKFRTIIPNLPALTSVSIVASLSQPKDSQILLSSSEEENDDVVIADGEVTLSLQPSDSLPGN